MTSFRQLVSDNGPVLVLDAASSRVQVGLLLSNSDSGEWQTIDDEAGVAVFKCLEALGRNPMDAGSFVYCDGPGSILGIRTTAMAIRTWQVLRGRPVYGYCSLAVLAHGIGNRDATFIADARRDAWHTFKIGSGLRRVGSGELNGELIMPENFRHWSDLPTAVQRVPYSLASLLPRIVDADLLLETDAPDAFLHEEPSYVTWQPQIHRAPTSP